MVRKILDCHDSRSESRNDQSKRIVSGIRPTGKSHLGNYFGALQNWVELQKQNDCFFFIADWHALTTDYQNSSELSKNIEELVLDLLSCGLNPKKSTFFIQSHIKEHSELFLLLSMITPVGWLERNPTYKDQIQELSAKDITNLGFLGYPVLQAADILIYQGEAVPVGRDQLPYLEVCREIARRANHLYGNIFKEPQPILTQSPLIQGTDGRKMSKSYNNAIYLSDSEEDFKKKIITFITDPKRQRRTDPGDPKDCPAFQNFHKRFMNQEEQAEIYKGCTTASIGCVDCKTKLYHNIHPWIFPIREERKRLSKDRKSLYTVLEEGAQKARKIASKTMEIVRAAFHL
ncbi:MAG: tryptophan--tRNA ligase [Deltaproteobacteria bacterium]|nr:tryptophan--tRNA ligase [Deltaproteobacteria bacterium]